MAKKKVTTDVVREEPSANDQALAVIDELTAAFGNVVTSGAAHADRNRQVISVSPAFDMATGGGIPEGSWNLISGPPKMGKSLLALAICRACQRPEFGGRKIFYLDVEHRLEERDLKGIKGLKLEKPDFNFIRSEEGKPPLTSLDYYGIAERALKGVTGVVVVFDSISAMLAPATMLKGLNEAGDRSSGYKLASQFCSMMESVVAANRGIVIAIAHQYANTSGMGAARKDKIPSSFEYQATTKLTIKKMERWRVGNETTGPQIGLIPEFFVNTSALGPPGDEFQSYMRFGVGVDCTYELIQLGVELGCVEQAGAWMSLPWMDQPAKVQGAAKMYTLLEENPALATELASKIREATA